MKRFLRILLRICVFPALLIHELSHFFAGMLVGVNPLKMSIGFYLLRGPISAFVEMEEEVVNKINLTARRFIIDIAPISPILCIIYLSLYITFFKYILIYELIFFYYSFLSEVDFNRAIKFIGINKEIHYWKFTKINSWLYYENLSRKDYLEKYGIPNIE